MLLYKLKEMACELEQYRAKLHKKTTAVASVKNLLLQIDYSAEVIPENSYSDLIKLLKNLKGRDLSDDEQNLLKEIVGN
jgi:hypothetical protein